MARKPSPSLCPWLGSETDQQMRWSFATARHFCWSPQQPREDPSWPCVELSMEVQGQFCLTDQHSTCPYFVPPAVRPLPVSSHPAREVCFFLGGKTGRFDYALQPTGENVCYSHNAPKPWWRRLRAGSYVEIGLPHQSRFCLGEAFRDCPFFDAEQAEGLP